MPAPAPPDLLSVLDSAAVGVFVIDRDHRVLVCNEACELLTGCSRERLLQGAGACDGLFGCGMAEAETCPADRVFTLESREGHRRVRLSPPGGGTRWLEVAYTPLLDREGGVEYVVGMIRDISAEVTLERQLRRRTTRLEQELHRARALLEKRFGFGNILSRSPLMDTVFRQIRAACGNTSTVLVCGESGTGKELVARAIHDHGLRPRGPFVAVNCAALPAELIESELFGHVRGSFTGASVDHPGLFRAAHGGTLFLDEVAEMPVETQAKLLRVLQDAVIRPVGGTREHPVDVRVVAATNREPERALEEGSLREDLYYRLSVLGIRLPPLRRRPEDIPLLVQHFLETRRQAEGHEIRGVTEEALRVLTAHSWPGNVRELENAIARACALGTGNLLRVEDLPARVTTGSHEAELVVPIEEGVVPPLRATLRHVEKELIQRALASTGGNKSRAAEMLGIQRKHLYRKLEEYEIDA